MSEHDQSIQRHDDPEQHNEGHQRDLKQQTARPYAVPEDEAELTQLLARAEYYRGVLPHPNILRQFNELVPGAAQDIIGTFLEQSRHRMQMERQVVTGDQRRANWGLVVATVIAIFGLALAGFLIYTGHDVAGSAIAIADIGSLVGAFIYGTNSRRQERIEKTKALTDREE